MAFTPAFTVAGTIDPSAVLITDTSLGSDANIFSKQISIYTTSNALLVPPIQWSLVINPLTINPLTQDIAVNIVVNWLDNVGNILYTSSVIFAFLGYTEQFYYGLTQKQTSTPNIVNDRSYYNNKEKLRCELDAATQAIQVGSDIFSSQSCINRAIYMVQNQTDFF